MSSHSPRVYLLHMRDCCDKLMECAGLRGEPSVPAQILLDAVYRNLEVLGEASRKLGPEFRALHADIPWREMNDLRNVLIHNYDATDADLVWAIVDREIPGLRRRLLELLTAETQEQDSP
jgi:uncharacterized protein with HEPN domain